MQNERLIAMERSGRVRIISGAAQTQVEATVRGMQPVYAHLYSANGEKLTVPLMYGKGSAAKRFDARAVILEDRDGALIYGGFAGNAKFRERAANRVFCESEERRRLSLCVSDEGEEALERPDGEHSDALNDILKRAAVLFKREVLPQAPFPGRFEGAQWRTVERPGAGTGYLEGSFIRNGEGYTVYAVPCEPGRTLPIQPAMAPPGGGAARPRMERDYLGRGYWVRVIRQKPGGRTRP